MLMFLITFRFASAVQPGDNYFVLLIITDGVITDMPQTKQAIVSVRTCIYIIIAYVNKT